MTEQTAPAYLDARAVARRLGVSIETVHTYRSKGWLPQPDACFGRSPVWQPGTIDTFVITSQKIYVVHRVRVGDHTWRVHRADTGRVLGLVEGERQTWRTKASERAFLGDGPTSGEPAGDWAPPELYAPLRASEGHDYLPGIYRSRRLAEAALQRYLDDHHAPAMGHPSHPDVRKAS